MSVLIGSARINEKGCINGGAAGDQTGGEVTAEAWYPHAKGWIVIRAKDPAVREKIARNMQAVCDNDNIGYCQDHRSTLTAAAKPHGYDASKVTKKVEVDCSEAVRNCVLYAGITVGTFSTASEVSVLKKTGKFDILEADKYCKSCDYLMRGDILVTKTKGHTVVVLSNGIKAIGDVAGGAALAVGNIVNFVGSIHYASANAASGPSCKAGKAKVTAISPNGKHPYHLIAVSGSGSTVYGWVDASTVQAVAGNSEIAVGDVVQFAGGPHYTSANATSYKTSPKAGPAKVTAISKGAKHPYHVVHTTSASTVYGWVDADKVSK